METVEEEILIAAPKIEKKNVHILVQKCFGLSTKSIKQLNSYDDKNFFIEVFPDFENQYIQKILCSGYVLKVVCSRNSTNEELLKGQVNMMKHLVLHGICAPKPVKNIHGSYISQEVLDYKDLMKGNLNKNVEKNAVLLITYLRGRDMADVDYSGKLLCEVGQLVGRIDNALKTFSCEAIRNREYLWNLTNVSSLPQYLHAVTDPVKQNLIKDVLKSWEMHVVPVFSSLEKGIIHGDLNDRNILVTSDDENPSEYKVLGIVDFGDVVSSPYIFELAIAITHALDSTKKLGMIQTGCYLMTGYASERKLTEVEWSILREAIGGRLIQLLVFGSYFYMLDPGNEYLLNTFRNSWETLKEFWSIPKDSLIAAWKNASI